MTEIEKNNIFQSFFNESKKISFIFLPIILLGMAIAVYFSQEPLTGLIIFGGIVCLPLFWACFYYPKVWIYLIILFGSAYLNTSSEGISPVDVVMGALYLGGLVIWFIHVLIVKKDKIVRNIADYLILFFFSVGSLVLIISALNGWDFLFSLREYMLWTITLLYFPIRYYIKERQDVTLLFILIAITVFSTDFFQFYRYYKVASEDLVYAYQLTRTARVNQSIFTAGALSAIVFFFYRRGWINRTLLVVLAGASLGALISTFTRTFWIILILQMGILFFYLTPKKKIEFGVVTTVLVMIVMSIAFLFLKDNTKLLLGVVESRFTSAGDGTQDVSVRSRLSEYEATFKKIKTNPLGGSGYGTSVSFYDPIQLITLTYPINHNSFIYIVNRVGFPLAIVYFTFFFYYLFKSFFLTLQTHDPFYKPIILSAFMSLLVMMIGSFTASIVVYRDGIFVIILAVASISIVEDHVNGLKLSMQKDPELPNSNNSDY